MTTSTALSHIDSVQRLYAAFAAHDMDTILDSLTDDVDWASEAPAGAVPWFGTYRGKADVPMFFQRLGSSITVTDFELLSITSNDTDVMVAIRWSFTANSTGKATTENLHHWWRFRDGKICFYRGSEDSQRVAALFS